MTPALRRALELHQPGIGAGATLLSSYDEESYEKQRNKNTLRESILTDDWPKKLAAFFLLFGQSKAAKLGQLSKEQEELERSLHYEESEELLLASKQGDLVEVVDGLLDSIYVNLHWLTALGFTPDQIDLLMTEVHASNMTKTDDEGKPVFREDGKVLKGPNFVAPSIRELLAEWGFLDQPAQAAE